MKEEAIYTIGYGKRDLDELVALLKKHRIKILVDVRSAPYSKFKPEFSKDKLASSLQREEICYVFMGDLLGGRPDDEECYVNGKVDYDRVKVTERFRQGICRLRTEWEKERRVCIMCSEGRPEECHRSKLIGKVLEAEGIRVQHIGADGKVESQQAIIQVLTGGQQSLFGETFTSRKRYRSGSS
ncbi:MAG: hypothetical protein Kow0059_07390 [Candidatus Sumerlaeia bacterium]